MKQLADALRLLRVFHDVSQTDLATQLGVSKSFLSEIESGRKEPTLSLLSRYSEKFDIPVSSLLFFAENVSASSGVQQGGGVASKVLKLLEWIAESRKSIEKPAKKPLQREISKSKGTERRSAS